MIFILFYFTYIFRLAFNNHAALNRIDQEKKKKTHITNKSHQLFKNFYNKLSKYMINNLKNRMIKLSIFFFFLNMRNYLTYIDKFTLKKFKVFESFDNLK